MLLLHKKSWKPKDNLCYECLYKAPVVALHIIGFPVNKVSFDVSESGKKSGKNFADYHGPSVFKAKFCLFTQWNK